MAPEATLLEQLMAPGAVETYGLTAGHLVRLREAFRLSVAPKKRDRRRSEEIAAAIWREVSEALAQAIAEAGQNYAEDDQLLAAVEARRGGRLVVVNAAGARRATSRDGIDSLADKGHLTADQLRAARFFRGMYERLEKDLQSQLNAPVGGGGVPGSGKLLARYLTGVDLGIMKDIERSITVQARDIAGLSGGKALMVLRAVAGEGRALRSLVGGSTGYDVMKTHLTFALDRVAAFCDGTH
jgi:hypothetical protein